MTTAETDSCLETTGIDVSFAGLVALTDVTLRLARGEILGLIGANGAGKTTLVNVITGYQRCKSGTVILDGEDITKASPEERARRGLARTFQAGRLFRRLTVEENLEAAAFGVGMRRRAARQRATEVLKLTRLERLRHAPAGALPYGEERRVALARALTIRPRFLAVDEPAAGMNETESEELLELVAEMRDRDGVGILMIEHDVGLVMRLCDRVQVLAEGKTICVGNPDEVQRDPEVIRSYLGTRKVSVDAA
ncbi:MAG TPA: ABC transporter ATP-binding protein [Solirubrobacteraceae bacterium]|jgi:branched-chain amino acid transport system ATP-binding protein|nr:ABC transporter ATP-binding protein [Solirubrobacteraceae bacterium]